MKGSLAPSIKGADSKNVETQKELFKMAGGGATRSSKRCSKGSHSSNGWSGGRGGKEHAGSDGSISAGDFGRGVKFWGGFARLKGAWREADHGLKKTAKGATDFFCAVKKKVSQEAER